MDTKAEAIDILEKTLADLAKAQNRLYKQNTVLWDSGVMDEKQKVERLIWEARELLIAAKEKLQ